MEEDVRKLLNEEEKTNYKDYGMDIGNLKLSPGKDYVAFNYTNLTAPNGWFFVLNLKTGKITKGPEVISNEWTDNKTIKYNAVVNGELDVNGNAVYETKTYTIKD